MFDMIFMHHMDIPAVDLNLLKAFDALMTERAVTRAASRIGLSQPAMSHALTRLRHLFGDALFVRTPQGMEPTARAREIAALIGPAVAGIRAALNLGTAFEPATTERSFTAGMAEYVEVALVERLTDAFARLAPRARLRLVTATSADFAARLDAGQIDAALLHLREIPPRLESAVVLRESMVALARRGHRGIGRRLALRDYLALPHVLVSPRGVTAGGIDGMLAERGYTRRVALVVATYLALPLALRRSELIATVPERAARRIAAMADLAIHALPIAAPVEITMAWHRRDSGDSAQRWFRSLLAELAAP